MLALVRLLKRFSGVSTCLYANSYADARTKCKPVLNAEWFGKDMKIGLFW